MLHAVIMGLDRFKTVCSIRFHGTRLKGQKFERQPFAEVEKIECAVCREKVITLRKNPGGGRCIILDVSE